MPDVVLGVEALQFQWATLDPFLFCVHHDDAYPAGNERLGPAASLAGRNLGQDFELREGWRMYHGEVVPGFPAHPHRGFETVTIVRHGYVDHSDSLGATARYGQGDVQWLTAGAGIQHAEMFPLLAKDRPNRLELFQIWLNLPAAEKMVPPHFTMLWGENIPSRTVRDAQGRETVVTVIAGRFEDAVPPSPPPHSYASKPEADVGIWTIRLAPFARFTVPPALAGTSRMLYHFGGGPLNVHDRTTMSRTGIRVVADRGVPLENGPVESELLLLQGRPLREPVAAYGPFVMNTREQIEQAFADYRRTRFGGWPWGSPDPVHPGAEGRFAKRQDGSVERAG